MNEDLLRAWVRNELAPRERREVTRWLVRCTDPEVSFTLHGLVREVEESPKDEALAALGHPWSLIVGGWSALVRRGRGVWSDLGVEGLVVAAVDAAAEPCPLQVTATPERWQIRLSGDPGAPVQIIATDDDGTAAVVARGVCDDGGRWAGTLEPREGRRLTLWSVVGEGIPVDDAVDASAMLASALAGAPTQVNAWRWVPET